MNKVNHCFIFARGGSKGLPRKNLMEINKIPLVGYSIKAANSLKDISKVFVSTDSDEIAETAHNYGAAVIQSGTLSRIRTTNLRFELWNCNGEIGAFSWKRVHSK